MRNRIISLIAAALFVLQGAASPETNPPAERILRRARDYRADIPAKLIRKIELPKGYHEGLHLEGGDIWVNNGLGGKTWVVNLTLGTLTSEIEPVAAFTEGLTASPDGKYWVTDWDSKRLYLVSVEEKRMKAQCEIPLAPSHPAGVIWNGSHLYVITWTRGLPTRFHLLKMDNGGRITERVEIKGINEPCQLAWDGKGLWISSWFDRRVYNVDVDTMEIKGHFPTQIRQTTGIAWDGESFWVTGTEADLYQFRLGG